MVAHHPASSVGVRLLDCDHREMGEILRELSSNVASGKPMQDTARLLKAIRQITLTHFAMEESMMLATRYPGLAVHRLQHLWLVEQTEALALRARKQCLYPGDQLLAFLTGSHLSHVHHSDNQYGSWLAQTFIASPPHMGSDTQLETPIV
jgi:hemerythrin